MLALGTGCLSGEDQGDTDGGGGSSGVDQDPSAELPGVRLNCCYTLANITPGIPPVYDDGCIAVESAQPCVDPSEWGGADAVIDNQEAADVCKLKCPAQGSFSGGPFVNENGQPLDISAPFDGCATAFGEVNASAMACNPDSPGHTDPWENEVAPTHEGTFSSSTQGSQADITINGSTRAVSFTGKALLGISDCEGRSRQEVCVLDLQSLGLELGSSPIFGDYQVDTAQLQLNLPTRTTASFVCDTSGCSGSFDFLTRTGTSILADFAWDQTNILSGAVGGGSLALGKDELGSITRVTGELELDSTKSTGTIRMWGAGQDSFGGESASVTFDLTGPLQLYKP